MKIRLILVCLIFVFPTILKAQNPKLTEDWSKEPPLVSKKFHRAPSDAIILYKKKKDLDNWQRGNGEPAGWTANCFGMKGGRAGSIVSKQAFGDVQIHLEWRTPRRFDPEKEEGQGRGNSGIYIMGKYEVQILDSWENETYYNGQAGAIYKQSAPLVNASRKPGRWQSYDIVFHAPRFREDGSLISPATVTVFHNGVLIQDHYVLKGPSVYGGYPQYKAHPEKLPIMLQDHGNPVKFRNIWVREL